MAPEAYRAGWMSARHASESVLIVPGAGIVGSALGQLSLGRSQSLTSPPSSKSCLKGSPGASPDSAPKKFKSVLWRDAVEVREFGADDGANLRSMSTRLPLNSDGPRPSAPMLLQRPAVAGSPRMGPNIVQEPTVMHGAGQGVEIVQQHAQRSAPPAGGRRYDQDSKHALDRQKAHREVEMLIYEEELKLAGQRWHGDQAARGEDDQNGPRADGRQGDLAVAEDGFVMSSRHNLREAEESLKRLQEMQGKFSSALENMVFDGERGAKGSSSHMSQPGASLGGKPSRMTSAARDLGMFAPMR